MDSPLEQIRIEKLAKIEALGHDPFGHRYDGRMPIAELRDQAPESGSEGPQVRAAGRIMSLRDGGKSIFLNMQDQTDKIQVMLGLKQVGEGTWKLVKLLDLWDLVAVEGTLAEREPARSRSLPKRLRS